jgi:hypothetical protein
MDINTSRNSNDRERQINRRADIRSR